MDLVSIIIPVFNSEKYIRNCLDSILSQTYNCIQVIIVDDGSTDNSYEICKEYTSSNTNFELYHTENRGVSHARNVGLEYAKGKYIFFVDSDDYVMPTYIEHLMDMGNYDYIGGGYRENNEQGWKKEYKTYYITIEDFKSDCRNSWEKVPTVHVHGSRYIKKIIDTNLIKFDETCGCGEDVRFNIEYFKYISSIAVSDRSEYIYCLHDESAIHKYWPERLKEEKEECIAKEQLYVQNDSFNYIRYVHWFVVLEHYYQHINKEKEAKAKFKEAIWDPYFRQCIRYCMKYGTLDMKIAAICLKFGTYSAYKKIIKLYVDRGKKLKNKVGIITIIGNNYGNRLQNWALQEVLKQHFRKVVTIPYYKEPITKQKIKYCMEKIKKVFHLKNKLEDPWYNFYFKICWESDSIRELKPEKYDYFVAGSDQIWNPLFDYNSEREFLTFANNGQKIAYAASIGLSELPVECFEKYRNFLYDFMNISVRETEAANIVFQLINRKVPVVLDPVFLIDKKEWCKLSQKSKTIIKKPYIFKYFLGKVNDEIEEYIQNLSIKQNLQIVDIMGMFSTNGPIEFISLIQNASLILTNSFHCTAFSIIFERDFLTFNRQKTKGTGEMSSRITTLLEKFELKSRFVNGNYDKKLRPINWDRVKTILIRERAISLKYIEESIGGKDEKSKSA